MTRNALTPIIAAGMLMAAPGLLSAEDLGTKPTDQQITQQVKDKLSMNEPTVAARIVVTTHDGVVTLMGMSLERQYIVNAVQDAQSVPGVVRVENRLKQG